MRNLTIAAALLASAASYAQFNYPLASTSFQGGVVPNATTFSSPVTLTTLNVTAGGVIDTTTAGALFIGQTNANVVVIPPTVTLNTIDSQNNPGTVNIGGGRANNLTIVAPVINFSKGANIASAATIAPLSTITHITGTTAIATITVPVGMVAGGKITLIFDAVDTWTAAGNIQVAGTNTTAGTTVEFTWDGSKWFPSRTS